MEPFSLNIKGRLREYDTPAVMGVVNVTPDSFFDMSRASSADELAAMVGKMIEDGADMIDVGACSTRPGSAPVDADEERRRLSWALPVVREIARDIPVSVDTFRASVAAVAVSELGADIINDVSGTLLDPDMAETVARLKVPYVLMHMRGTPATMATMADYSPLGVTATVGRELATVYDRLRLLGVNDIIIDPGLGFAKTPEQGFRLLRDLEVLREFFHCPLLVGVSRKTMLGAPLGLHAVDLLPATVAANTVALINGASILRVHDVAAARQAVGVYRLYVQSSNPKP